MEQILSGIRAWFALRLTNLWWGPGPDTGEDYEASFENGGVS